MDQSAAFLVIHNAEDHAIDLVIGSYFFAMRSHKFSKTPTLGKTKMIMLEGVNIFIANRKEVNHQDSYLIKKFSYIWILFENQNNQKKFDKRTQNKTSDAPLCPVHQFGMAVQRVCQLFPGANDFTSLCSIKIGRSKFVI